MKDTEGSNTVHFFLLCIAKALQLQLRDRSSKSNMETTMDQIDANDWLKGTPPFLLPLFIFLLFLMYFAGTISAEVAREVVVLLRGLRDDSPPWMAMIDGILAKGRKRGGEERRERGRWWNK